MSVTLHRSLGQARRALGELDEAVVVFRTGAAIGHELGATAMALELDIASAIVVADLGDPDQAAAELADIAQSSDSISSVITASWARTALGWVELRRDPHAAIAAIEQALTEAREIDYAVAVAVGLRSLAYAHLLADDVSLASDTVGELLDDLLRRGALSNLRLLVDIAGALAHQSGHPSWERLTATARSLPITTLVAAHFELIPLPATSATPLARHEVIGTVRQLLVEIRNEIGGADVSSPHDGDGEISPPPSRDEPSTIRRLGDAYEISYAGRTVVVRAGKGVVDIVRLIEAGGAELHCLDLAGAGAEEPSTGETIDATARRQYENRIRDLQAEVDEAEANSDYERAYRSQIELDQLIEHLSAAIGHGNRARRTGGSAERARSAVAHRIRAAIRQVEKLHPRLATHLRNSINTGTYCSYRPEAPVDWHVS